jgi:transposase-like protein
MQEHGIYNFLICGGSMKQFVHITCRYCHSDDLITNGRSENGTQRYRCTACHKSFQLSSTYRAWKPGVKEQIVTQTLNRSGVRDISRNLGISQDTVTAEVKKKNLSKSTRSSQLRAQDSPTPRP